MDIPHSTYDKKRIYADDSTQIIQYRGPSKEIHKRRTIKAIEEVNNYERKWKIQTNTNKFKIVNISKRNLPPISITWNRIEYARQGSILGCMIGTNGLTKFANKKIFKARKELFKLKRFSAFNAKTKLHLYKALVMPHLDYAPVPTNVLSATNKLKIQIVQNKALRWINGDRPPYDSIIEQLHNTYNLQAYNVRIYTQAMKVWEKIRTGWPEEVDR